MDDADRAQRQQEIALDRAITAARGVIEPGTPGECEECGEWSPRLIHGDCAWCRDKIEATLNKKYQDARQ